MASINRGDIVNVVGGEFANNFAKIKKIDRHNFAHLDIDPSLRPTDIFTGRRVLAKCSIEMCELAQLRLIDYEETDN